MRTAVISSSIPGMSAYAQQQKVLICSVVTRFCANSYGAALRALILTGSLARNEASLAQPPARSEVLSDAEFLLIFHDQCKLPGPRDVTNVCMQIECKLTEEGIDCRVCLSAAHTVFLSQLKPHIFAYELKTCGQVLLGDTTVLQLIPAFHKRDIPTEDAWRLLCNRVIEQFTAVVAPPGTVKAEYATLKLVLDMATSFLVFAGAYEPTYIARADVLRRLARQETPDANRYPFVLSEFAERVANCTKRKLGRECRDADVIDWKKAAANALVLLGWELSQLTNNTTLLDPYCLHRLWMRSQSPASKLRGWASVIRKHGYFRSYRYLLRWLGMTVAGSPRYWVYAAATLLLVRVANEPQSCDPNGAAAPDVEFVLAHLPVVNRSAMPLQPTWRDVAQQVAWNYRMFLEDTRS